MNKYYTPELEDLHIGYVCEIYENRISSKFEWYKMPIEDLYDFNEYLDLYNEGKLTNIRTKYLDKEDIESLGLKVLFSSSPGFTAKKLDYYLDYDLVSKHLSIHIDNEMKRTSEVSIQSIRFLYEGECKSINELKKIMKWLNIK